MELLGHFLQESFLRLIKSSHYLGFEDVLSFNKRLQSCYLLLGFPDSDINMISSKAKSNQSLNW